MSSLLLLIIVQNGKQAQYHFCDQCHSLGRGFLGPVPTLNFTSAEPNTYLGRPKLLSSTVDSDGRAFHVQNLIRGKKKYHTYCSSDSFLSFLVLEFFFFQITEN